MFLPWHMKCALISVRAGALVALVAGGVCTANAVAADRLPESFLATPANLTLVGVPLISVGFAEKLAAYSRFNPSDILAWHSTKRGVLIRSRLNDTPQLMWIDRPSAKPVALTNFVDAVGSASFQPVHGDFVIVERDTNGDENFRLYRVDARNGITAAISSTRLQAGTSVWNANGDRVAYGTSIIDHAAKVTARSSKTQLHVVDPQRPETSRVIATSDAGRWSGFRFSPDGRALLIVEAFSSGERLTSQLWQIDIESGKKQRISPAPNVGDAPVRYGDVEWSADGRGLFAISDRDAEFSQLAHIDLASGKETPITAQHKHDVASFAISTKADRIAFVTTEEGTSVLRFLALSTFKELPRPALLPGEISGLRWREPDNTGAANSGPVEGRAPELAFNLASARSQREVFSYDIASTKLTRWTNGASVGLSPLDFVLPRYVEWKSFDELAISGLVYQPDAKKFTGKRPVLIVVQGDTDGQARAGFIGRHNYAVNELGVAVIFANVRGSDGFGKRFRSTGKGTERDGAMKDVEALFDWIKMQPDLDASRVLISAGGSGEDIALAMVARYPDRLVGGIVNGSITVNLKNVEVVRRPMLIAYGKNDPRFTHANMPRMIERLKGRAPTWSLMASDEGRAFATHANQNFLFYVEIMFMQKVLFG